MYRFVNAAWETGPVRPRLAPGQVDVWRMSCGSVPPASPADCRQRAHRWRAELLAVYLGIPPGQLRLVRDPGGKPRLDLPGRALEFSLSHSASGALLAVSAGPAVGIDLETRRRVNDPLRIARRVFPADTVDLLERCGAAERLDLFLDHWTRMEARQKALGRGIFEAQVDPASVQSFGFVPGPAQYATLAVATVGTAAQLRFYQDAEHVGAA